MTNAPHAQGSHHESKNGRHTEGFQGLWPMAWPKVGGGGHLGKAIDQEELFKKMCAWEDANYLMAALSVKDGKKTKGTVIGFLYTIRRILDNCGDTGIGMIEMRARRGIEEIQLGGWEDGGPQWLAYPEVYEACGEPEPRDDGIFWIQKEDFFAHFRTIFISAMDMRIWLDEITVKPLEDSVMPVSPGAAVTDSFQCLPAEDKAVKDSREFPTNASCVADAHSEVHTTASEGLTGPHSSCSQTDEAVHRKDSLPPDGDCNSPPLPKLGAKELATQAMVLASEPEFDGPTISLKQLRKALAMKYEFGQAEWTEVREALHGYIATLNDVAAEEDAALPEVTLMSDDPSLAAL